MSEENNEEVLPLGKLNYKIIGGGFLLVVLGLILMVGGGTDDPTQFNYDEIFSPVRITLAPFVMLVGLGGVLYGIMKKPQDEA